ncbi:MAG: RNA polymerase sigma factor [Polyangiaceae bacterium]|nr:RNA polymerase sigma factor [Polyangiaceae bacterium]
MPSTSSPTLTIIGPELRASLVAMVRRRVPESDAEDIVQAALAEAIESPHAPTEVHALRRWIFGVAKNKIVDFYRRRGRETFDLPDVPDSPAPHGEADLLRWAQRHLPEGQDAHMTLDWMLREGDGEKLESIAESEKVPAPRVRKRVSRLRNHFRAHWAREVALLAALGVVISVVAFLVLRKHDDERIAPVIDVDPSAHPPNQREDQRPDQRAAEMRERALAICNEAASLLGDDAQNAWRACIAELDEAKRIGPNGDSDPTIERARAAAGKALAPAPTAPPMPTHSSVPVPTPTSMPPPQKRPQKATDFSSSPPPARGNSGGISK